MKAQCVKDAECSPYLVIDGSAQNVSVTSYVQLATMEINIIYVTSSSELQLLVGTGKVASGFSTDGKKD